MTIISLIIISIVTFRFSELQKFKNLTSRVPIFGIQEVKKLDFKNSDFRNALACICFGFMQETYSSDCRYLNKRL